MLLDGQITFDRGSKDNPYRPLRKTTSNFHGENSKINSSTAKGSYVPEAHTRPRSDRKHSIPTTHKLKKNFDTTNQILCTPIQSKMPIMLDSNTDFENDSDECHSSFRSADDDEKSHNKRRSKNIDMLILQLAASHTEDTRKALLENSRVSSVETLQRRNSSGALKCRKCKDHVQWMGFDRSQRMRGGVCQACCRRESVE